MPVRDTIRGPAMLVQLWQTLADEIGSQKKKADEDRADEDGSPSAAVLEHLRTLRFTGADVENFLQGYLTIDLNRLADGAPHLTALTNLKGRVVANGWCRFDGQQTVDWLVHESLAERVIEFMARYLAFSRTEVGVLDNEHLEVGLIGPDGTPTAVLITTPEEIDELLAERRVVPAAVWQEACIANGVALLTRETSEAFLPQMLGLVEAEAVDFDKGCYLGQEVVARAQHRGEVKRRLTRLMGIASAVLPGDPVLDPDGREQGIILTTAPAECLAVLRTPLADEYRVGEVRLKPLQS